MIETEKTKKEKEKERHENRIDWFFAILNISKRSERSKRHLWYEQLYGEKVPYGENESDGIPQWNLGKKVAVAIVLLLVIFFLIAIRN